MSRTIRELVEERSVEIVGRAAEKAALLGTLDAGGQLVVFVHGIAGVGKSTLLDAFAADARNLGATLVRIDCRSLEPTERGFLDGLGGAVGGGLASAEEAADRLTEIGERVVLVLDTYEVLRLLDTWIRQIFAPVMRDNTRLVVASRDPPSASWFATPGWSDLVLSIRLGNLTDREADELLTRSGLETALAERVNRLARGHPLSLELAAAAVRARPDVDLEEIALQAILEELTKLYLDGLDQATREAIDASAVVRRITLPLLEAMLPARAPHDVFERVRALPFVQLGHDGLIVHDTIREAVARALCGSDPATYRRYRAAAWRHLRNELPMVPPAGLWRQTADMLYLIEHPVVREAFFPTTEHVFAVEQATSADAPMIETIVRRHEPDAAAEHVLSWWKHARQSFSIVRDRDGGDVGFTILFEPDRVSYGAIEADPVTRSWREHLRLSPVPRGQRVLFCRRWLSERAGELPSGVQAAGWLDIKRVYMELRPQLRRIYVTVRELAVYAPIVTPLGFVPLGDPVDIGDVRYHSAVLDFGPSSVDGWLAKLAARELLIGDDSILDPVERQLVLDGRRVDLTRLEFEVLDYLLQREGKVVERSSLLRDVWGSKYVGSNVIEAAIRSLRRKLGERAPMIETVRSIGYRLRLDVL